MSISINGSSYELPTDFRTSLLDFLREDLRLTGTKKGCNQGACGACTVLVNGERVLSCLTLACQVKGEAVTTVEGLATNEELHPLQKAFVSCDGFQCGYCTPGQLCSALGMIKELERGVPSHVTENLETRSLNKSSEELRERMSGNLCRCGAYNGIIQAITETMSEARS